VTEKIKIYWVYGFSILFIIINGVLIVKEIYWSLLFPLTVVLLMLYLFAQDKLMLLLAFLTPLSVNIRNFESNLGVSLPVEPLMFAVLIIFFIKLIGGFPYDKKIFRHPLSVAIIFMLVWMLITTFTSEIPWVSAKTIISQLWFIIPFFYVGAVLFKKFSNIKRFIWLYMLGMVIVIFYTTIHHSQYGFDEDAGNWVMRPFYNDHTAYGAALSMLLPFIIAFVIDKNYSFSMRAIAVLVFVILFGGLFLSFSRASWISIMGAFAVYILVLLRIKFKWIAITFVVVVGLLFSFQHQILEVLERNKQDSSANFVEHVQSMYNITSDASNLERINRWQSGIRMFYERPVFGWGPGTYQFVYAPFQRSKERTIISTNAGDLGNAHSEYISPLSEQGVFGLVAILIVVIIGIYTGFKVYRNAVDKRVRTMALTATLSLIAYFTHGFLNNFLDTDKLSVLVWSMFSIIMVMDLYHTRKISESY
jgi:putative inorganic carbon (hco3(-)) transporter